MEKKGWKITAIIFIVITILSLILVVSLLESSSKLLSYEKENIKSCAIGCYIQGYSNSYVDESSSACLCDYPFNQSLPSKVKLSCDDTSCRAVPLE